MERRSHIKNQSAFTLIEVLVSLLILSVCIVGTGKILLESKLYYKRVEQREKAVAVAGSVVEAIQMNNLEPLPDILLQYWQNALKKEVPGSVLAIEKRGLAKKCYYIVTVSFATLGEKPLEITLNQ